MNLTKITVKNLGSFENCSYDFSEDSRLILIEGINNQTGSSKESNGSGKSTFFIDLPEWVLFGRMKGDWNKEISNTDILRISECEERVDSGYGELDFILNDIKYTVRRDINKKGSQTLDVYYYVNGDKHNLTRSADIDPKTNKRVSGIANTQRAIEEIICCNSQLFYNSVCFEQGNLSSFSKSSKNERQDLLAISINLNNWLQYSKLCKEKLSKIKQKLEYLKNTIQDEDILFDKINGFKKNLEFNEETFEIKNEELYDLDVKLTDKLSQSNDLNKEIGEIHSLEKRKNDKEIDLKSIVDHNLNIFKENENEKEYLEHIKKN